MLFAYRSGKSPISRKAWRKLDFAEQQNIPYPKQGVPNIGVLAEDRSPSYEVASRIPSPSDLKLATRTDCEEYVAQYLDAAERDPNGLAYAFKVIRKYLDPQDFEEAK